MTAGLPTRADAARNRALLLAAAEAEFAEHGSSASVADIARRAGVAKATVFRHFPTKDDLYRAVIENRLRSVTDDGRALLASQRPGEALFDFVQSMVQWGDTDQGLVDDGRGPASLGYEGFAYQGHIYTSRLDVLFLCLAGADHARRD